MRINTRNIKKFLVILPRSLATHSFLTFLGLLFLALILSGFIFYQDVILMGKISEPMTSKRLTKFEEETYQKVLEQWQKRKEKFDAVDSKQYSDLFQERQEKNFYSTSSQEATSTQKNNSK
jgi:hypothetical protein